MQSLRNAAVIDPHEIELDTDIDSLFDYEKAEEILADVRLVDTIIISDIHLGSDVSRSKHALKMLKSYSYKRLILNGDVFEDLNFKRLRKDDWKFLSYIRKLSNHKRGVEVVWVAGNHDGIASILTHLLGILVVDEYQWESDGQKYLAIHGHQFDSFLNENVIISELATIFYKLFQRLDTDNQRISRWMKQRSKVWLRVSGKVAREAIEYAREKGVQHIFCGHTHQAMRLSDDNITYYNSGCWTDKPSQFISIDLASTIAINDYA